MSEKQLSIDIENLLVARNLRQMRVAQAALHPGYYLRAARLLRDCEGCILIGTGFPVADTFETDGPVGAIALYEALSALGAQRAGTCHAGAGRLAPESRHLHRAAGADR
jgi:hypothetical protein